MKYFMIILLLTFCASLPAQQNVEYQETIILIQGIAKRVHLDSSGNILKILADEPEYMGDLFIDRPPIPDLPPKKIMRATTNSANKDLNHTTSVSQDHFDVYKLKDECKGRVVLQLAVDITQYEEYDQAIDKLKQYRSFLISQSFKSEKIRLEVKEINGSSISQRLNVVELSCD